MQAKINLGKTKINYGKQNKSWANKKMSRKQITKIKLLCHFDSAVRSMYSFTISMIMHEALFGEFPRNIIIWHEVIFNECMFSFQQHRLPQKVTTYKCNLDWCISFVVIIVILFGV